MSTTAEDTTIHDAPVVEQQPAAVEETADAATSTEEQQPPKTPPPAESEKKADEAPATPAENKKKLEELVAKATKQYGLKNYAPAAETYAEAAEIQAKLNGEDNPLNADLLYLYGRALFQCGVQKSDVLGGGVEDSAEGGKGKGKGKKKDGASKDAGQGSSKSAAEPTVAASKNPNINITGDENWTEEDEEGENGEGEGEGEDGEDGEGEGEQDDFTLAWEILDLARILFIKRLESSPPDDDKDLRKIKESLSDVYDLLGEVSLESESFKQAVDDLSESLRLKKEIYQTESTLISEAHYKLSLALEFASQGGGEGEAETEVSEEDQKEGRKKSAEHMKMAIDSCQKRIELEEKALADATGDTVNGKPRDRAEKSLTEAKELVKELEQRLRDLTMEPTQTQAENENPLQGVLGSLMGMNPAEARKHLEQAISGAKDLGSMVRKKEKQAEVASSSSAAAAAAPTNGSTKETSPAAGSKRKADDEADETEDTEMTSTEPSSKKARVTTEEEEQATTA